MVETYRTIYKNGTDEIVEKKSRFIAHIGFAETEEEALAFIEKIKKQYWDARHNCYAFRIGSERIMERCSDDGEPSGTAGKPMLEVLAGQGLCNVVAVVTRYFGGTLLGTGGLVRAYTKSTQAGIEASVVVEKKLACMMEIVCDYSFLGKVQYIAATEGIHIADTQYTDCVTAILMVPVHQIGHIKKKIVEASNGAANLKEGREVYYGLADGELVIFE
ncbi:MAG: YigZ family protein [Lachnospiraceae bacterium]|nr:YigZ family protein [Lachnospiraceae bacterium]